jgi:TM2 domain-containing membrane protein YozV
MKGSILQFDSAAMSGLISGHDGERYTFDRASFSGDASGLAAGAEVDFVPVDGKATQMLVVPSVGEEKSRIMAAVLAFFLGSFGVHKFYMGKKSAGIIMLVVFLLGWIALGIPSLIIGLIAFIEFIIYLVKSDADFKAQYINGNKSWF